LHNLLLLLELRRWRRAGRTARLWWRDDDAAAATPRLERLLRLADAAGAPLTLAVVPAGDMAGLGARLAGAAGVSVVQHGVDHRNRRTGPVAGEFPEDWTQGEVETALRRGWRRVADLPGAEPIYAPPWNDAHPRLEAALAACGYAGWSANGALDGGAGLPRADAHLDLLRWRGGARFRGRGRFLRALAAELRGRRLAGAWEAPIGLLTHHLVHDAAAWDFLAAFLHWTADRPEVCWAALPELIGGRRGADVRSMPAARSAGLSLVG
jgi:hypothetical protein